MKTDITPQLIREALQSISANLSCDQWARVGMAIKSEFSDDTGLELFTNWSATADGYHLGATRSTWHSIKAGGGVGIDTLLNLAKEQGFNLPKVNQALTSKAITDREKIISRKEKRSTSFHEAGHAAICFRFGGSGVAQIWRNTPANIKVGQRAWLGSFVVFAEPESLMMDEVIRGILGVVPAPENWRILLGMAGLVAEQIANDVTDAYEIYYSIKTLIGLDQVSKSDLDLMGDWQFSDVVDVVYLLIQRWFEIERHAGWLELCWGEA